MRLCASPLERIGDHAAKICLMVELIGYKNVPGEILQDIEEVNGLSIKIVDNAVDSLFKKNIAQANATFALRNDTADRIRKIQESLPRLKSDVSVPLGIMLDSIDRVCDYGCNIAEIAINSAVSARP
jgi:phosphate uptake regulator